MPISNGSQVNSSMSRLITDFCWGVWSELGVSGWGRTHQNWLIDPEPLIIFTSLIGNEEPRLRDEAIDWCIHNWRYVSQTRLKNILQSEYHNELQGWGVFAATVNARAGANWPMATDDCSSYKETGKSTLRPLFEPSLFALRMRAIFGMGARTEILRYFALNSQSKVSAAELAETTNYVKRNIAQECDLLVQASILSVKTIGNRFYYSLSSTRELVNFVGSKPSIFPDWNALLRVIGTIKIISDFAENLPPDVLMVETHQAAHAIQDDLAYLGICDPRRARGKEFLEIWEQWAGQVMTAFATGGWPSNEALIAV